MKKTVAYSGGVHFVYREAAFLSGECKNIYIVNKTAHDYVG
jgi:hypothetical protein